MHGKFTWKRRKEYKNNTYCFLVLILPVYEEVFCWLYPFILFVLFFLSGLFFTSDVTFYTVTGPLRLAQRWQPFLPSRGIELTAGILPASNKAQRGITCRSNCQCVIDLVAPNRNAIKQSDIISGWWNIHKNVLCCTCLLYPTLPYLELKWRLERCARISCPAVPQEHQPNNNNHIVNKKKNKPTHHTSIAYKIRINEML